MENGKNGRYTDLTYLNEIAKDNNEFMVQMLNIFIEQTPQAIARIEKALGTKDWKSLRQAAHKIKPSLMFVGLTEIKEDVPLLEEYAAEETHLDDIPRLVDKISKVCTEAVIELKEELKKFE